MVITKDYLLEKNYKHINLWNSDLYVNEDGTIYRLDKRNKIITLCNVKTHTTGYKRITLRNNQGKKKQFKLNRLVYLTFHPDWDIFNSSTDNSIDHINGITTDDRISNLRNVTNQHNSFNAKCKGYSYNKQKKKYQTQIQLNGKSIHLGLFDDEQDARKAYLDAKPKYHVITEL